MPRIPMSEKGRLAGVSKPNLVDVRDAGSNFRGMAQVADQITKLAVDISEKNERSASIDYVNQKSLEYERKTQEVILKNKVKFGDTDHAGYAEAVSKDLEDLEVELYNAGPNKNGQEQFIQSIQGTKSREILRADLYGVENKAKYHLTGLLSEVNTATETSYNMADVGAAASSYRSISTSLDQSLSLLPEDKEKYKKKVRMDLLQGTLTGMTDKGAHGSAKDILQGKIPAASELLSDFSPLEKLEMLDKIKKQEVASIRESITEQNTLDIKRDRDLRRIQESTYSKYTATAMELTGNEIPAFISEIKEQVRQNKIDPDKARTLKAIALDTSSTESSKWLTTIRESNLSGKPVSENLAMVNKLKQEGKLNNKDYKDALTELNKKTPPEVIENNRRGYLLVKSYFEDAPDKVRAEKESLRQEYLAQGKSPQEAAAKIIHEDPGAASVKFPPYLEEIDFDTEDPTARVGSSVTKKYKALIQAKLTAGKISPKKAYEHLLALNKKAKLNSLPKPQGI